MIVHLFRLLDGPLHSACVRVRVFVYLCVAAFVLVYVVYVVVVIAGRYIYQKIKKRKGGGDIPCELLMH